MQLEVEQYCYFSSPIGQILLAGANDTLLLLGLPQGKSKVIPHPSWRYNPEAFSACRTQLSEYFAGQRQQFNVEYQIQGTEFQQQVLNCVAQIPFGATAAYSEIATKIQQPAAVRAVGGANANNPLPIIIPCHRVIGKNGALTGFGGGLAAKRVLLELEGCLVSGL